MAIAAAAAIIATALIAPRINCLVIAPQNNLT
jgi:hypothetical protein